MSNPVDDDKFAVEVLVRFSDERRGDDPTPARAVMNSFMKFQVGGLGFYNGDFIGASHFQDESVSEITIRGTKMVLYKC